MVSMFCAELCIPVHNRDDIRIQHVQSVIINSKVRDTLDLMTLIVQASTWWGKVSILQLGWPLAGLPFSNLLILWRSVLNIYSITLTVIHIIYYYTLQTLWCSTHAPCNKVCRCPWPRALTSRLVYTCILAVGSASKYIACCTFHVTCL